MTAGSPAWSAYDEGYLRAHQWAAALAGAVGRGNGPAVQLQPAGMPPLRFESPWAPLLYVFVHHLLDGRPPGVPLPEGLLERAAAQGRATA